MILAKNLKITLLCCAIIVSVVVYTFVISPLGWIKTSDIYVVYDGKNAPHAKIYRHQKLLLLSLENNSSYTINPTEKTVSTTSLHYPYFWLVTEEFAIAKTNPPYEIDMRDSKNDRKDPKLELKERSITFTDIRGRIVRLEW